LRKVITADVRASNGVVHIIDGVMLPPGGAEALVEEEEESSSRNIVELAQGTPDLSTLVAAVVAADLASVLSSKGPFTVFAPVNAAFAALGDTVGTLLKPENKGQLTAILLYHVLDSQVLSSQLSGRQKVTTVEGRDLQVNKRPNGQVLVGAPRNLRKVITADVRASNGVVHIIDGVMLPPGGAEALVEEEEESSS